MADLLNLNMIENNDAQPEADLLNIDIENNNNEPTTAPLPPFSNVVDLTLLRGLEPVMEAQEQVHLTNMMTSGNADDLAAAAKIFWDLGTMLKAGATSPEKRTDHMRLKLKESFLASRFDNRAGFNDREQRVLEEKKVNDVEKEERSHRLPLPVRMPRMEVLSAFDASAKKKVPLTFVDDPWDGTLGSAFTRLEVHRDANKGLKKLLPIKGKNNECHIDHDIKFSPGFDAIVDRMPGGYSARLIEGLQGDTQPRVLIASVQQEAAKLGLQRGDVVTHVNGKPFTGNVKELNELITSHYQDNKDDNGETKQLELVLNAELCVAQALKLRAMDL